MSWRPKSGRASIPKKQPGCETEGTRPGGPIRGLAQSTDLAFSGSWRGSRRKNDWPKKKEEGYGGTHLGPSRQLRS
ncbi:hypothetical protein Aspvir_001411 [Aspergillus viridinutans]|uniref:Uncharacterized protein n=1 Tax=Aspergillus viridinutans TaxID=75553 RepID=A0A9P3BTY8_ASPVI|nr:uncharacterized protein Aspvir_001411 [Aspergillus viridinutans]GIJ99281.1 hypothetical protein Aspvir_001411 [Aspergillus viridinutans]